MYVPMPTMPKFFGHFSSHGCAEHHLHFQCGNTAEKFFLYKELWLRPLPVRIISEIDFFFWISGPNHQTLHCKNSLEHTIPHIFRSKEMLPAKGVTLLPHPGQHCAFLPATSMFVWLLQALDLKPRFAPSALWCLQNWRNCAARKATCTVLLCSTDCQ